MSATRARGPGMLMSQMEPPPGGEAEFHQWYEHDHIPARLRLRGFSAARRYVARLGAPRYIAMYELSDLEALRTPEYEDLKRHPSTLTARMLSNVNGFTRFICEASSDTGPRPAAPWLSLVAFSVPTRDEDAFDRWYESEHVPLLMRSALWWRVRRYRVTSGEGGPWTHMALHEIASDAAMDVPERHLAREGPLRAELASQPWFATSGRWLYELISSSHAPTRDRSSSRRIETREAP